MTEPDIGIELLDNRDAMAVVAIRPHPEDETQLKISVHSNLDRDDLVTALRFATDAIEGNGEAPGAGTVPQEPEA